MSYFNFLRVIHDGGARLVFGSFSGVADDGDAQTVPMQLSIPATVTTDGAFMAAVCAAAAASWNTRTSSAISAGNVTLIGISVPSPIVTSALPTSLEGVQAEVLAAVKAETQRRILLGFDHAGKTFGLSDSDQANARDLKAHPPTFPYTIYALDGSAHVLDPASAGLAWYEAGVDQVRSLIAAGRVVHAAVAAAGTVEAARSAAATYLAGS